MSIVSKDGNYEFHLDSSGRVYWYWEIQGAGYHVLTSTKSIPKINGHILLFAMIEIEAINVKLYLLMGNQIAQIISLAVYEPIIFHYK